MMAPIVRHGAGRPAPPGASGMRGAAAAPARVTDMATPPDHERVVARLLADARAVRPLWSPHTRLVLWLVVPLVILGGAVQFGLREDVGRQLRQPRFLLEHLVVWHTAPIAVGAVLSGVAGARWLSYTGTDCARPGPVRRS